MIDTEIPNDPAAGVSARRSGSAALRSLRELSLVPAIVIVIVIGSFVSDAFLTKDNILNILLQNILQRANKELYTHMFVLLGVDPSMWICKWFMNFYIYSFPRELVKYVFDLVVAVGNLGMIKFAVSLI